MHHTVRYQAHLNGRDAYRPKDAIAFDAFDAFEQTANFANWDNSGQNLSPRVRQLHPNIETRLHSTEQASM